MRFNEKPARDEKGALVAPATGACADEDGSRPTALDRLTAEQRSDHMRRIRKVDTKPELIVRKAAHALGRRFRLHRRDLSGTPDLVFPRDKKAIWVHGCFWHQHSGCRLARQPKTRLDYWLPKLRRNVERDAASRRSLEAAGWRTLVVWECETGNPAQLALSLRSFLLDDFKP